MPYIIKKVKGGYKVAKKSDPKKVFSKRPLTKEQAEKQMKAIIISEYKGGEMGHLIKHKINELFGGETKSGTYYYVDPRITIPDLANFINSTTDPFSDLMPIFQKLDSPQLDPNYNRDSTYYRYYTDNNAKVMEVIQNLKDLVKYEYDQSMELINAIREGNNSLIGKIFSTMNDGIALFDQFKEMSTPMGMIKMGIESLGSFLSAVTSPDFNKPTTNVSYSYKEQLQHDLGNTFGPFGMIGATISGTLGELFGAKSPAQINDKAVEARIQGKYDLNMQKLNEFEEHWKKQLKDLGEQNVFLQKQLDENQRQNDLMSQYHKEVYWMDRLTDDEYRDRWDEPPPPGRKYISFEDWKRSKGIGGSFKYGEPVNKKLYNKVKEEVYKKNPKHSLFRSAQVQKEYQEEGGKYKHNDNKPKMGIDKWFKQEWLDAESFLNDKIVPCGAKTEYDNYPLCRPKKILEELGKDKIQILLDEKNKIGNKPLRTSKILNTNKYNIKPTKTGTGGELIIYLSKKINEL